MLCLVPLLVLLLPIVVATDGLPSPHLKRTAETAGALLSSLILSFGNVRKGNL